MSGLCQKQHSRDDAANYGTLYGIGLGPGDPELITLKGYRILQKVPVVFVPVSTAQGISYALSIAQGFLNPQTQEIVELPYIMTRDRAQVQEARRANCHRIAQKLKGGRSGAFLTEGDPSLYSTFIHAYLLLRQYYPRLPVEVVPGVSSVNAAAATAGVPLVDGEERMAILPATRPAEELRRMLREFDTVVLLKVNRVFETLLALLEEEDLARKAVFVQRCGRPEEEVVWDLESLRGRSLDYFSLVLVKTRAGPWTPSLRT